MLPLFSNKQDDASGTDSAIGFGVRNRLITEPIKLIKIWNDNGLTETLDGLHDPVSFTVLNDGLCSEGFTMRSTLTASNVTAPTDGKVTWQLTTDVLPVYDKNRSAILYTVTETVTDEHTHETSEVSSYTGGEDPVPFTIDVTCYGIQAENLDTEALDPPVTVDWTKTHLDENELRAILAIVKNKAAVTPTRAPPEP